MDTDESAIERPRASSITWNAFRPRFLNGPASELEITEEDRVPIDSTTELFALALGVFASMPFTMSAAWSNKRSAYSSRPLDASTSASCAGARGGDTCRPSSCSRSRRLSRYLGLERLHPSKQDAGSIQLAWLNPSLFPVHGGLRQSDRSTQITTAAARSPVLSSSFPLSQHLALVQPTHFLVCSAEQVSEEDPSHRAFTRKPTPSLFPNTPFTNHQPQRLSTIRWPHQTSAAPAHTAETSV